MASISEKSFGARLRNAQNLSLIASETANYNPPNPDDKLASFNALLQTISQQNTSIAVLVHTYDTANKHRQNLFEKDPNSMVKLLSPIRSVVLSTFGSQSLELSQVSKLIQQIRGGKAKRNGGSSPNDPDQVSFSQQSYGSRLQFFNDLIQVLQNINGYNPDRADLQITALQTLANDLHQSSNRVLLSYNNLKNARNARLASYEDLHQRAYRIKAHIKAQNGVSSPQYQMIRKLVI